MVGANEEIAVFARLGRGKSRAGLRKTATYYNLRRRDIVFNVGDLVLKRQHVLSSAAQNIAAKLASRFHGPFKISKILSPVVYELADLTDNIFGKMHVKDLKEQACRSLPILSLPHLKLQRTKDGQRVARFQEPLR